MLSARVLSAGAYYTCSGAARGARAAWCAWLPSARWELSHVGKAGGCHECQSPAAPLGVAHQSAAGQGLRQLAAMASMALHAGCRPAARAAAVGGRSSSALSGQALPVRAAATRRGRATISTRAELMPLTANPLRTAKFPSGGPLTIFDADGVSVQTAELTKGLTVVAFLRCASAASASHVSVFLLVLANYACKVF